MVEMVAESTPHRRPGEHEFIEAGLLDPSAPSAAVRRELLEWLSQLGFTVAEMVAADGAGELSALVGDRLARRGLSLTMSDVADRTGLSVDRLIDVRLAAGLPAVGADAPEYSERDLAVFELLADASELFSWVELLQFVRVVGSSIARITDAATSLFLDDVERPLRAAGATEFDLARHNEWASEMAVEVNALLAMLMRSHLSASIERSRQAQARAAAPGPLVPMAVGFIDLVGFTARSADLTPEELVALISRFESVAHDLVAGAGGRMVKLIGDEVMFVAVDPDTGCQIAIDLLRVFGEDETLTPRGGLAYGDVLARSGDFFGPTVNLAARLVDLAVPHEVLTTPATVTVAGRDATPAGRRILKGFPGTVEVVSLEP